MFCLEEATLVLATTWHEETQRHHYNIGCVLGNADTSRVLNTNICPHCHSSLHQYKLNLQMIGNQVPKSPLAIFRPLIIPEHIWIMIRNDVIHLQFIISLNIPTFHPPESWRMFRLYLTTCRTTVNFSILKIKSVSCLVGFQNSK